MRYFIIMLSTLFLVAACDVKTAKKPKAEEVVEVEKKHNCTTDAVVKNGKQTTITTCKRAPKDKRKWGGLVLNIDPWVHLTIK